MTFREYSFEIHAYRLRDLDSRQRMHMQAWVNQQAKSTKTVGKNTVPFFKNFKEFFDYEKELQEIEGKKKDETIVRLANLAARING
ncbi:hypothetical protein [Planomicrobium okeanokoites]|uniref:Phage protein n=1 Tax=Planomicrobium okeanokoites TaxID=244 RepID=A0ABV7KTF6_PLAOK|nr:hypothetical protein [Planomicrobium okeanokoites]TAA71655.1 hypothetical protein D2910_04755 [Planomicrobium okeanokoites]